MALTKWTADAEVIQGLSDTPNATEGLTADQLKKKFDDYGIDNKTYINEVLTVELDAEIASKNDGWNVLGATLTYASASTINTNVDLTGIIGIGDKVKFTQTTVKYFVVTAITSSLITFAANTDYVVANAAITSKYYSHSESPFGFPQWFNFTPVFNNVTLGNGSVLGKFNISNKIANVYASIVFGSTTSITGNVNINAPVTCVTPGKALVSLADATSSFKIGYSNVGAGGAISILAQIVSGTALAQIQLSSTVPFTWTTDDALNFTISYGI